MARYKGIFYRVKEERCEIEIELTDDDGRTPADVLRAELDRRTVDWVDDTEDADPKLYFVTRLDKEEEVPS